MDRIDDELELKFSRKSPFRVPDDYFDHFASELIEHLPEPQAHIIPIRTKPSKHTRRLFIAAASVCAVLFGAGVYWRMLPQKNPEKQSVSEIQRISDDNYMDAAADYTMLDNEQIYAYVAGD